MLKLYQNFLDSERIRIDYVKNFRKNIIWYNFTQESSLFGPLYFGWNILTNIRYTDDFVGSRHFKKIM